MTILGFPLAGSTLIVGPSQAGKTQLTARAFETWIDRQGAADVVILEFGPEYEHGETVLGRRLERYMDIPAEVWVGRVDAYAPRAESETETELRDFARENARAVSERLSEAPDNPSAVFVNDTTLGFQHEHGDVDHLLRYCETARVAVLNAFESDELGTDDPVSKRERQIVERLRTWADRTVMLDSR